MLESRGFQARIGLRVLEQRSLITYDTYYNPVEDEDVCLSMHDHIEEMGQNIVRREHPNEPCKHSRMWKQEEIEDVLGNDLGTKATRCISLKFNREIVLKGLRNMEKLECLIIYNKALWEVRDDKDCQYLPNSLRYLHYDHYPHRCLPKTFLANNLVTLNLRRSNIKQLWEARKVMKKLKFLDLSDSKVETLDLGLTPNLVRLSLRECYDLVEIHVPDGSLKGLVHLDLFFCEGLKSFSFIKELESLEVLWLNLLHLKELPDIIPSSLQKLQFCLNDIEYLPSSIGNLHKLVELNLGGCRKLKGLSERICSLQHLKVLNLRDSDIEELPDDIGQLEHLEMLGLSSTKVKHLPDSICKLKHLKYLDLLWCKELEKLPENLGDLECLEMLVLSNCCKIREIPSGICKLKHLKHLKLSECNELEKLPENLGDLKCLEVLDLADTPISHLPHSISLLKGLEIRGYEKRTDPDALLFQEQQHTTRAPKRRCTDIEATTSGDVMNESQPFDLNVQSVDQASPTSHIG